MAERTTVGEKWIDVAVVIDRTLRSFAEMTRPALRDVGVDDLHVSSLTFLLAIGKREAKVSDLVREGRYLASNASYAIKSLQTRGLVERRTHPDDRRNAILSCTPAGLAVIDRVERACSLAPGAAEDAAAILRSFEAHCAQATS